MKATHTPKSRLKREDWIDKGIELLTRAGIGAVSIEKLATTLGVTRGSFYYHFSDREDLLQAMLEHWAKHWTFEVRDQIASLGLDPGTTLLALLRAIRANRAADHDAPFRAWALYDPKARAVIHQVDETRLGFIRSQFEGLGFTGLDAENRAQLFLYYEVAAPAIFAEMTPEQEEQLLLERYRFLTTTHVE